MTAVPMDVGPTEDTSFQPVPWQRMVWVSWRQHRVALMGTAALLSGVAVYLWIAGRRLHHAYAAALVCHPAGSIACGELTSRFDNMDKILSHGYILQALPAVIGAFLGAPVLARELETGTFRYAWTQGFGRWRWALAKLVLLAVVTVVAAGTLSAVVSWFYRPYFAMNLQTVSLTRWSPLASGLFDLRGVAFAAWTLTAFAIGGLAGIVIRRVVPAIVATLVAYAGAALVVGMFVRQHYLAPVLTNRLNIPASALITNQWWTEAGKFAFGGRPPSDLLLRLCPPSVVGPGKPSVGTLAQCLSEHGYTQWTQYQPASRFWVFQLIEGSWLLALSAALIGLTVWMVRRRTA